MMWLLLPLAVSSQNKMLVFQTDFGVRDGAVASMKGVAMGLSPDLKLYDLTHEIPNYNIWEAAYRLEQAIPYWPAGTVFISVVDPGVGTSRRSVVVKTKSGHFIVTPDNGTLTLVSESIGIESVRIIDEEKYRRPGSGASNTFYGRDLYTPVAARLAAGLISFEQVGNLTFQSLVSIPYTTATRIGNALVGTLMALDPQYGNVWSNISIDMISGLPLDYGSWLQVTIYNKKQRVFIGTIPFVKTFGDVPRGKPLGYLNSMLQFSIAMNQANFAALYHIQSGNEWKIEIKPIAK
jgi:S-adenosylmethionine hydrolase